MNEDAMMRLPNETQRDILSEKLLYVRSMFYLLTPNETYYENLNQVPDFLEKVKWLCNFWNSWNLSVYLVLFAILSREIFFLFSFLSNSWLIWSNMAVSMEDLQTE